MLRLALTTLLARKSLPRSDWSTRRPLDAERVARAIEFTRFPCNRDQDGADTLEPRLVQAADLIGQLGDPLYLKKANALFYEFEENGFNRQLGSITG
jgi:hypothetical protein